MERKEASEFGPASLKISGKGRNVHHQTSATKNGANGAAEAHDWHKLFENAGAAINRASTLEELFRCLAEKLRSILPYDIACLALRMPDQESIRTQWAARGDKIFLPAETGSIPLSHFRRFVKSPDHRRCLEHLPEKFQALLFPEKNYYPAILLIPLYGVPSLSLNETESKSSPAATTNGIILGCYVVASHQRKAFSAHDGDLLAALGDLLAAGIQRVQLMEENLRLLRQTVASKNVSAPPLKEIENRRRDEEQENFVYVVSHNLKTPLVSIQGFANILHEELGAHLNKEHRHFLERLRQNAALMEKMVLDLLEFSRLGRYPFTLEMINVSELVESVIEDMRLLGQLHNVEFIFSPKNFDELRLYADGDELKTVFENLLTNAVKYRRPGVPLRLEIGWDEQPRFHALWVRDNGIGMEENFRARAFELFQRGANAGQIQGTGIGLAIVRRIIENHKGLVRVDSKLGEGTAIYFTLPKLDDPPPMAARKTSKLNRP